MSGTSRSQEHQQHLQPQDRDQRRKIDPGDIGKNPADRVEQGAVLVDQAGATMTEVVSAIRRVTEMVGEITAASHEQSDAVQQVGVAVTRMDQVTQENAALVEEMAAAAGGLQKQAQELVDTVVVFKLEGQPLPLAASAMQPGVRAHRLQLSA